MDERMEINTSQKQRTTPIKRAGESKDKTTATETPWRALQQLASIPRTPIGRASSAGPTSARPSQRRTPATRTPTANQRIGSARRPVVVTPHGRAARRELDLRRTGLTPGRNRRRSFIQQRHTPRDDLRALSRLLAPKTLPIEQSPEVSHVASKRHGGSQDDSDDEALERPRLSLAFGDDEDDDSLLLPPKSAGLENDNNTMHSVEFGRRAHSEKPPSRLSRGSFGTVYMSDVGDDSRLDGRSEIFDSSIFPAGREEVPFLDDEGMLQVEHTGVLRGLGLDRGRQSLISGRESGIRPQDIETGDDGDTFVFNIPQRDPVDELHSSPIGVDNSAVPGQIDDGPDYDIPGILDDDDDDDDVREDYDEDIRENEDNDHIDRDNLEVDDSTHLHPHGDESIMNSLNDKSNAVLGAVKPVRKKKVKLSKHGIQYPSLPLGVVKKLATSFARTAGNSKSKLSKEALDAITQASDWFFEQASEDLGTYAGHAGRKTIEESDVIALMSRQRLLNATTTPFSLAQRYLPRELLQDLRMVPPSKFKAGRQLQSVVEEDEEV